MPTFIYVDRHTEVNESCHLQRTQAAPEKAKGDVSANNSVREVEIPQHYLSCSRPNYFQIQTQIQIQIQIRKCNYSLPFLIPAAVPSIVREN